MIRGQSQLELQLGKIKGWQERLGAYAAEYLDHQAAEREAQRKFGEAFEAEDCKAMVEALRVVVAERHFLDAAQWQMQNASAAMVEQGEYIPFWVKSALSELEQTTETRRIVNVACKDRERDVWVVLDHTKDFYHPEEILQGTYGQCAALRCKLLA